MAPRPHKVICISLYHEDLKHLDALVEVLKRRDLLNANRSRLIRFAVKSMDLEAFARELSATRG